MRLNDDFYEVWHPDFIRTTHARMIFETYADILAEAEDILPNMHWTWIERNPKFETLLINNLIFRSSYPYSEYHPNSFEAARDDLDCTDSHIKQEYVERFVVDLYRCYKQLRLTHVIVPPALIEPTIVSQLTSRGGGFSCLA